MLAITYMYIKKYSHKLLLLSEDISVELLLNSFSKLKKLSLSCWGVNEETGVAKPDVSNSEWSIPWNK